MYFVYVHLCGWKCTLCLFCGICLWACVGVLCWWLWRYQVLMLLFVVVVVDYKENYFLYIPLTLYFHAFKNLLSHIYRGKTNNYNKRIFIGINCRKEKIIKLVYVVTKWMLNLRQSGDTYKCRHIPGYNFLLSFFIWSAFANIFLLSSAIFKL